MTKKDEQYEGREDYFVDVDRMISEGLGRGTVNGTQAGKIEEARPFEKETPPNK
ncbi:hypothetical protein [Bacillus solitudinis]|uniref:hypothetical protein n=1 Tax=Bacillus solitudinis TaxID=2014074 RepID=UPI0018E25026|nr:hypothetical protein [Bacillus solitudinis]